MFRRLRVPSVLLVLSIAATLMVGAAAGEEPRAKAAVGPVEVVTVSAPEFRPFDSGTGYTSFARYLTGDGTHWARVPIPTSETIRVTNVKFRVYDLDSSNLCVFVHRPIPADGAVDTGSDVCTEGSSPASPQTLTVPVFQQINRYQTVLLGVEFDAWDDDLRLYGATVFYRVVS